MRLLITNNLTGERSLNELSQAETWVGRPSSNSGEPGPDIAVPSRMISRRQLKLWCEAGGWRIEHHGRNDSLLQGQPLPLGRAIPLPPGEEVEIGDFTLMLVAPAGEILPSVDAKSVDLMALEQAVHTELLKRMDLRREGQANKSSPETQARIHGHLQAILDDPRFQPPPAAMEELALVALYRRLSRRVLATGGGATAASWRNVGSPSSFGRTLTDLESRLAADIGLSGQAREMAEDWARLEKRFAEVVKRYRLELTPGLKTFLVRDLVKQDTLDLVFGVGPLQDLLDTEAISEIMVVTRDQIYVEKFGLLEDSRRAFFNNEALMSVIEQIVMRVNRQINQSTPLVDARLPDGSRVNAVIPPIAVKGPCLTIRKFAKVPLTIEDMLRLGALSLPMVKFLHACVEAKKNIVVSGGTGSGKTTLLNCLSRFIPHRERIVTIEDTAELQLQQEHVVTLEARPPNMEGKGEITLRDLVRNALRMRPDRIIIGECRGPEALDMLQAMNTGHDGSMTTGHANTPQDMMLRLETLVLTGTSMPVSAIRAQIAAAVHLVVQLNRFADGARRVTQIAEVTGIDGEQGTLVLEDIFRYRLPVGGEYAGGKHLHTGYFPSFVEDLLERRLMTLDTFF